MQVGNVKKMRLLMAMHVIRGQIRWVPKGDVVGIRGLLGIPRAVSAARYRVLIDG
jgi:hypothetical protein